MMDQKEKVRENRMRRVLERRGYCLVKNKRRDPRAIGFGCYKIIDTETNAILAGGRNFDLTLDDVEAFTNK
jgi:hypothetical protein